LALPGRSSNHFHDDRFQPLLRPPREDALGRRPLSDLQFRRPCSLDLFRDGFGKGANSLVGNSNLIKKVYFPRLAIPLANTLSGIVDFAIAFVMLLVMMLYFGIVSDRERPVASAPGGLAFMTSLGVSLWLSAMNVQFRDVQYLVPFLTQFWLFATPIAYPSSLLSEPWRTVYAVNPMVGVVEGFRWALLNTETALGR